MVCGCVVGVSWVVGIVGVMSVCVVGVVGVVGVVFTVSIGYLLCDLLLFLATNTRVSWVPFETSACQWC